MPDFDFSGAREGAMAALSGTEPASSVPAETSPQAPVQVPPAVATPPAAPDAAPAQADNAVPTQAPDAQPATPQAIADLSDDAVYSVNGEQLTGRQIKDGWLRQADYTKKTQAVSEERAKLQEVWSQVQQMVTERQQLQQVFQDPALLAQHLSQYQHRDQLVSLLGATQQAVQVAAQDAVAQGQQPALNPQVIQLQSQVQQLQTRIQQQHTELQNYTQEQIRAVEDAREVAKANTVIEETIDHLTESHPLLKALPHYRETLRFNVKQRYEQLGQQPESAQQIQQFFREEAQGITERVRSALVDQQKATVARQALATNGIEPPGDTGGVQPQPVSFQKPDGRTDWTKLREATIAEIQRRNAQG